MSGEEPPLEVHKHSRFKARKGEHSSLTKHSDIVSFLFKIQYMKYMRQGTLFIGESVLENKIEE